jgi:flagellar basal-body rod modification protein FlgD
MSGTIGSTSAQNTAAQSAALQASLAQSAPTQTNSAATTSTTGASSSGASATGASSTSSLAQLAGNFTDFLSLLTTQLQNQDPTSPMDTTQFTSELVQFTSVQEQINNNATLNQLLTTAQGQQLSQASSLVGQTAQFTSTSLPLQNGTGQLDFTSSTAQPVQITLSTPSGQAVTSQVIQASSGANTWTWNGQNSSGQQMPDGPYTANVTTVSSTGTGTAIPFTVVGTITGAEQTNGAVQLMFGSETTTYNNIVTFGSSASSASTASSSN